MADEQRPTGPRPPSPARPGAPGSAPRPARPTPAPARPAPSSLGQRIAALPRVLARPGASPSRPAAPSRRPTRRPEPPIPWRALLAWPVGLSVAITLLRLVGELRGWSPAHFSRLPGGGFATVGITWLIPFVGLFVGWRLGRAGHRPESAVRAAWQPLAALAVAWAVAAGLGRVAHTGWTSNFVLWGVASLVAVAIAYLAWPAAGAALLAYAGAARAFVAAVMALAIARGWGTHYDAVPPGFPHMDRLPRFLLIGLLPQMTIWVGLTVAIGVACAVLGHRAAARFGAGRTA